MNFTWRRKTTGHSVEPSAAVPQPAVVASPDDALLIAHQADRRDRDFFRGLAQHLLTCGNSLSPVSESFSMLNQRLNPKPGSPLTLPDETECLFGQWYYGEGNEAERNADFRRMEVPHRLVHSSGQAAMQAHARGELEEALKQVAQMEQANAAVMRTVKGLLHSRLQSAV